MSKTKPSCGIQMHVIINCADEVLHREIEGGREDGISPFLSEIVRQVENAREILGIDRLKQCSS